MKYEYKKLFSSKLMLFMIVLTLGYMFYLPLREVWTNASEITKRADTYEYIIAKAKEDNKSYGELYDEINAVFSSAQGDEKPTAIYSDDAFLDMSCITLAADKLHYVTTGFETDRRELVKGMIYQNASENKSSSPGGYFIKAGEKAIRLYNRRIALKFESTGILTDISYPIFNYSMWEYVMIALCVLMTVRLFGCEYTKGAYRLVNTSKRTVKELFFRKYLTVISVAVGVLAVQAVFELLFCMRIFGLKNLSLPLQQIQMYEYCPYRISIAQFYLLKFLARTLAYVTIISVSSLVTTLIKKPLISNILLIAVSAGGLLANMMLFVRTDDPEKVSPAAIAGYDKMRIFMPQSLLNIKEYFKKFDYFSLFGQPVSRLAACVFISLLITALCAVSGYMASGRIRRSA